MSIGTSNREDLLNTQNAMSKVLDDNELIEIEKRKIAKPELSNKSLELIGSNRGIITLVSSSSAWIREEIRIKSLAYEKMMGTWRVIWRELRRPLLIIIKICLKEWKKRY